MATGLSMSVWRTQTNPPAPISSPAHGRDVCRRRGTICPSVLWFLPSYSWQPQTQCVHLLWGTFTVLSDVTISPPLTPHTATTPTAIFSLIYGMVKENTVNLKTFLALLFIEDLQLFAYSWRSDLVGSNTLRWIFNFPLIFVENFTLASHIISLLILAILALSMVYCGFSLSTGQMRTLLPLHTLRFLTALVSTVLYIPILCVPFRDLHTTSNAWTMVPTGATQKLTKLVFRSTARHLFLLPLAIHRTVLLATPT